MKKLIILLNMGGPNNLDEVKIFLTNMFNDENIISIKNTTLRKIIASFITKGRTKYATNNYKKMGGKSPIIAHTKNLCEKIQDNLDDTLITFAMRYTPPFVQDALKEINLDQIDEIFAIPLYPHFSITTVKSSLDDLEAELKKKDFKGKYSVSKNLYKNDLYNKLLVTLIKETLNGENPKKYDLIFSAHSLPEKIIKKGDTYQKEVLEHIDIISNLLNEENIKFNKLTLAYQSKLGPLKWLSPDIQDVLKENKNKNVIVFPISFVIDNSETEFELHMLYGDLAKSLNYESYKVVTCPNDLFAQITINLYKNKGLFDN